MFRNISLKQLFQLNTAQQFFCKKLCHIKTIKYSAKWLITGNEASFYKSLYLKGKR